MAVRDKEAQLLIAKANRDTSVMYAKAADIMKGNNDSVQLRYFETLKDIASDWSNTVILPNGMLYSHQ